MVRRLRIVSTGAVVPGTLLTHDALDRELGLPEGSSLKATGVRSRHISTTETAAFLAARACTQALENAGLTWDDVDCLVAASATMDQALPYNAAMIHAELGLCDQRTTTFDIGASCMSFLTALDVCSSLLETGRFRRIMITSADVSTFTTDRSNFRENGIFGDGGAACLIESCGDGASHIITSDSITFSEGVEYCRIRSGGTRYHRRTPDSNKDILFEMMPRPLFALIAKELPPFVDRLMEKAGVTMDEIDLVVPHQASQMAVSHIVKLLGIDPAKVVDISAIRGNQVGASLPTALHHGLSEIKPARGSKILLLGSGAGVTIGGMVLVY